MGNLKKRNVWIMMILLVSFGVFIGASISGVYGVYKVFTKITTKSETKTELGREMQNAKFSKAVSFSMIDAKTMEVVNYPAVSEGKDATIFLFW